MPAYAAGTQGSQHGVGVIVRNAETPASGTASIGVALPDSSYDKKRPFSVQGKFAGAPGAFEDDVQCSDTDVDANYTTVLAAPGPTGVVSAVDGNNNYRIDFPYNMAKFVRVLTKTQNANAVTETITITP